MEKRGQDQAWLRAARKSGISHFVEHGFPTLRDEDWRFTNVEPIASLPFKPLLAPTDDALGPGSLDAFPFAGLAGPRLVFINGHFAATWSRTAGVPTGVLLTSLAAALASDTAFIEAHLFQQAHPELNAFVALNDAFFQDGAFIHVPADVTLSEPIQILHVATAKAAGATAHLRNLIVIGTHSQATVIEHFVSLEDTSYVVNTVTELHVGEGAAIEYVKVQDESHLASHLATLAARSDSASNVIAHSIALGARLSRTNIHAHLAGQGLECVLNGLYLTHGEQLADHYMIVEHARPHCASHEYFNGILSDRSKGVFHGRILVQPGAQKTDAKQTNKNLLLSGDATINSKPQLEIYADDVKCTHGATVGQLNEEAIFYLRSRAIGEETARRMLVHAFAGEIVERVRCAPLRAELDQLVWTRLEEHHRIPAHPPCPPSCSLT